MTEGGNNVQDAGNQTIPPFTRPRFFQGQMLAADDLQAEQDYIVGKRRWHNRLLHGYGVVCGLEARQDGDGRVIVEPGYAIDALGNDIIVESPVVVVLGQATSEQEKPDERHVALPSRATHRAYLAAKYAEQPSAPVPVAGGSPEGESVEFTRVVEGLGFGLLPQVPVGYHPTLTEPLPWSPCPRPVAQPWVLLAVIYLGNDGTVLRVTNDSRLRNGYSGWAMACRRLWSRVSRSWR